MDKNSVLIAGTIVYKDDNGKGKFFVVKESDDGSWEFPKVVARKGESSVRAALRLIGEKGGMTARVIEEVGRYGGASTVGGKTIQQRYIYYLMYLRAKSPESIGFNENSWLDFNGTLKKLASKKEQKMLKDSKDIVKDFKKWKKQKIDQEEEEEELAAEAENE